MANDPQTTEDWQREAALLSAAYAYRRALSVLMSVKDAPSDDPAAKVARDRYISAMGAMMSAAYALKEMPNGE